VQPPVAAGDAIGYYANVLTRYYIKTNVQKAMKRHDQSQKSEMKAAARTLSEALLSLQSPKEVREFLEDLCTPAEIEAMVDRWRVAQLLDQGYTYRDIREMTEVSVTTVGRVARSMELGAGGYRTVLERLARKTP